MSEQALASSTMPAVTPRKVRITTRSLPFAPLRVGMTAGSRLMAYALRLTAYFTAKVSVAHFDS